MRKIHKLCAISVLSVAFFVAGLSLKTTAYANGGTTIDSLSFDYEIIGEAEDGSLKYTGELPVLSLKKAIEPQFFTGSPIEPRFDVYLTYDGETYPVDLNKDCDLTYENNLYVSLTSGSSASVTVSLKRDPHISETFYFLILPVRGYIDVTVTQSDDTYMEQNTLYLTGLFAYAELKTTIPYDDAFRRPENVKLEVLALESDTDTKPVLLEFTEDGVLKVNPGKAEGAVKVIFTATDTEYNSFTDASYEVIIVNNLSGTYEPDYSKHFVKTDIDAAVSITDEEVPEASEAPKGGFWGIIQKLFSRFGL